MTLADDMTKQAWTLEEYTGQQPCAIVKVNTTCQWITKGARQKLFAFTTEVGGQVLRTRVASSRPNAVRRRLAQLPEGFPAMSYDVICCIVIAWHSAAAAAAPLRRAQLTGRQVE